MNLRPRDRALLGAVAAFAVAAAVYVLVLTPQRHQAARLNRSIAAAQKTLASAQAAYTSGRAARARLSATADEYVAARRAVPEYSNVPGLLRLLQRTAAAAHVQLNSINLTAGGSSTTSTATATSSSEGGANTVPISLSFNGGYAALNRLVHRLDALVAVSHDRLRVSGPLVGISNIALSGAGASGLTVTLTATIYQYGSTSSVTGSGGTS